LPSAAIDENYQDAVKDDCYIIGKYRGGCTQCLQPEGCSDTGGLPQPKGLRWTPADAGLGVGAGRNKLHPEQHREIHLFIHRQPEFHDEQLRLAGTAHQKT